MQTWEEVSAEVTRERTCSEFGLEVVTASRPALLTVPFLARAKQQHPRNADRTRRGHERQPRPYPGRCHRGFGFSQLKGCLVFFASLQKLPKFRSSFLWIRATKKLSFKACRNRNPPIPPITRMHFSLDVGGSRRNQYAALTSDLVEYVRSIPPPALSSPNAFFGVGSKSGPVTCRSADRRAATRVSSYPTSLDRMPNYPQEFTTSGRCV